MVKTKPEEFIVGMPTKTVLSKSEMVKNVHVGSESTSSVRSSSSSSKDSKVSKSSSGSRLSSDSISEKFRKVLKRSKSNSNSGRDLKFVEL